MQVLWPWRMDRVGAQLAAALVLLPLSSRTRRRPPDRSRTRRPSVCIAPERVHLLLHVNYSLLYYAARLASSARPIRSDRICVYSTVTRIHAAYPHAPPALRRSDPPTPLSDYPLNATPRRAVPRRATASTTTCKIFMLIREHMNCRLRAACLHPVTPTLNWRSRVYRLYPVAAPLFGPCLVRLPSI